jgi:hypothetical protein
VCVDNRAQLNGSDGYNETSMSSATPKPNPSRWTFSLRTFLVISLVLSLLLGYVGRVWWKAYRDSQPPTLHELAQIAKRHGMPMPPKEAKLVLGYRYSTLLGKPAYSPAFLLRSSSDGGCRLLVGDKETVLQSPTGGAPNWREFVLGDVPDQESFAVHLHLPSAFVCAAQLEEIGQHEQAAQLLQQVINRAQSTRKRAGWARPREVVIEPLDLRLTMAYCAYAHTVSELHKRRERWPEIRKQLQSLLEEFPKLRTPLFEDLAATLDGREPSTDSIEALLLEWSRQALEAPLGPFEYVPGQGDKPDQQDQDYKDYLLNGPAREIVLRGFDAVPALIALRHDRRLTVHWIGTADDGTPQLRRVGDLACDLLREISGFHDENSLSVPFPDEVSEPDVATWKYWFELATAQGEREYYVENLRISPGDSRYASLPFIVAAKYPESLREVCDRFDGNEELPYALDSAIARAPLPVASRVELLEHLVKHSLRDDTPDVLHELAGVDHARAAELALPLLAKFPIDVEERYHLCPEARLAGIVAQLDDPRVWRALLASTQRASVGLRVEMLVRVHDETRERTRLNELAYLAAFLDDETVCDSERGRDVPPETSVRHVAAAILGGMLDLRAATTLKAQSPEEWDALRAQVRERLKQEELPELE